MNYKVNDVMVMYFLYLCILQKSVKSITIWTVWNGLVLIIRFIVLVLILSLNVTNQVML